MVRDQKKFRWVGQLEQLRHMWRGKRVTKGSSRSNAKNSNFLIVYPSQNRLSNEPHSRFLIPQTAFPLLYVLQQLSVCLRERRRRADASYLGDAHPGKMRDA